MDTSISVLLAKPFATLTNDEYSIIKNTAVSFSGGIDGALWKDVIIRAFCEVSHKEGTKSAMELIQHSYDELNRVYPQLFQEKSELLKTVCLSYLQEQNINEAHKAMERYLYNALAQVHYSAPNAKMPYYSFRSFSSYSLSDIEKETICLAHPREFNDPLDTILVYWLDAEIKKAKGNDLRYRLLMKKVAEHIKIRCFIAGKDEHDKEIPVEDLNVLMWAHYADSHKGFCVKYEFTDDWFDRNQYVNSDKIVLIDRIKYVESIKIENEPSIKMALLEKSSFWEYENEMRLISFDFSGDDLDYPTIECKGAVKAVYLGAKCSDTNRRKMEKAIGDKNIPLYQMSVDETTLTKFKKTLIG